MALIPQPEPSTAAAIDQAWHDAQPPSHRVHLGASIIGRECRREVWYSFRWATALKHTGRLLRLFDRGQEEEKRFVRDLEMIGATVWEVNPDTGRQYQWADHGGHFGGSCDGFAIGLPEAPVTLHLLEMKTHGDKSYKALESKGVKKSKPEHAVQMNQYLHWAKRDGMDVSDSLYMAVNKNDDRLYTVTGTYDQAAAEAVTKKAGDIIASSEPPGRIRDDATHYYCRSFCDHRETCNGTKVAEANCRTCVSSKPNLDDGTWGCTHYNLTISEATQRNGGKCPAHIYIPALVPFAEPIDGGESPRFVRYKIDDTDFTFSNGTPPANIEGPQYASRELQHLQPVLIQDEKLNKIVKQFDGEIVGGAGA